MALPEDVEIIGAGWCRTGTSSLKVALDALGYDPCFHGRFIPYLPNFREDCHDYATGKSSKFDVRRHFGRYKAAVDIPAGLIPLVLDAYPEAKVCTKALSRIHSYVETVSVREGPCVSQAPHGGSSPTMSAGYLDSER